MTAAFNLSQLANNLNTSGQIDATDGLSGLVANANLASSGTASSSTFLRGDRIWATAGLQAASSAEAQAGTSDTVAITPLQLRNGLNASGSAPIYACRAWVNFNGSGTIAIRSSGNVSSITDNGTGQYVVNFSTAMPDANYSKNVNTGRDNGGVNGAWTVACTDMSGTTTTVNPTASSFAFFVLHPPNQTAQDPTYCNVSVFR